MTKEEIAQWVIDNRYPKSDKLKVSDSEMYHMLVDNIEELLRDYNRWFKQQDHVTRYFNSK